MDDVERITRVALVEDDLVAPELSTPEPSGHRDQPSVVDVLEERAPTEDIGRERVIHHGSPIDRPRWRATGWSSSARG